MPTHLLARGAVAKVTVVRLSRLVVTVGRDCAPLLALGRLYRLLHAARDGNLAGPAVARHLLSLRAGVTRSRVAPEIFIYPSKLILDHSFPMNIVVSIPGLAFVILAVERLRACLLARRTILVAALSVAGVLPAVLQVLALDIAGVLLGTRDVAPLVTATARFLYHLHAWRTSPYGVSDYVRPISLPS